MSNQALILVDIQNDYFPGGAMELVGMDEAAANAAKILANARQSGVRIFHIQHLAINPNATFFLPDTTGAEHHEIVQPASDEVVIKKHFPSAFRDTELAQQLAEENLTDLQIVGAMSHMCIDATTRAAFDAGFNCTVVQDACATKDLSFNGRDVRAADVHAAFMAALSSPYANVVNTANI